MTMRTITLTSLRSSLLFAGAVLTGCQSDFLEFTDPDIITDASSASGAIALRNGVIQRFTTMVNGQQGPDATWIYSGLLADEWRSGDTFEQRNQADQRAVPDQNTFLAEPLLNLYRVRTQGRLTISALREFAPVPSSNIGLMFALTAYVENLAGEVYCNGIPFSNIAADGTTEYGQPLPVDSVFKLSVASADSALKYIEGTDGPMVRDLAAVVKGRALLNLNRPADALAAVAGVALSYEYRVFHSVNSTTNQIWALNPGARRYVVANQEGGNGLPFVAAADPRVPTATPTPLAFDSQTPFVALTKYGQFDPVVAASGIEARLIEAEAALRAGDATTWLEKLNAARATRTDLPPLTDPTEADARVNLTFYERAFWMFGTGHRLGDLRRLVRQYGRGVEAVFPTGAFPKGGNYGSDPNLPITFDETNNPNFTDCIDRNA
jgi:starch-binding outer membrane protein, SusD/RagB family